MAKNLILLICSLVIGNFALAAEKLTGCDNNSVSSIGVIKTIPPKYPTVLKVKEKVSVRLKITVNSEGELVGVDVLESELDSAFARSAKKSIQKWKFSKSDNTNNRCGIATIEFRLKN